MPKARQRAPRGLPGPTRPHSRARRATARPSGASAWAPLAAAGRGPHSRTPQGTFSEFSTWWEFQETLQTGRGGLGGRQGEQRSDGRRRGAITHLKRFQAADLRDKIPGRGSFCPFSGLPATASSGKASDAGISLGLAGAPLPRGAAGLGLRRLREGEPAGFLPRSPGMGGGSRPGVHALRETPGGYWPASPLRRGCASTNFLPGR